MIDKTRNKDRDISLSHQKQSMRQDMRHALKRAAPKLQKDAGQKLLPLLSDLLSSFEANSTIALFASLPYEICTRPLDRWLQQMKFNRAYPDIVNGDLVFRLLQPAQDILELVPGTFQVKTPPPSCPTVKLESCSAIITPGLAFDRQGHRLGQGKGYYDRAIHALRQNSENSVTIGVMLDLQRVGSVPFDAKDEILDYTCASDSGLIGHL
jgi:5-formyltetrahydrofolate cyclo-ligase